MYKKLLILILLICAAFGFSVEKSEGIEVVGRRINDNSLNSVNYGRAQVITAEDIKKSTAKTIPDLLQEKIGLIKYSNATGSDIDWTLNYGGFNSGEDFVVIVDGVKVNETDDNVIYWSTLSVSDIEKIEVIPGAQSAVFGSGAFAGVINITTKKVAVNEIDLSAGSYGFGRQNLVLGDNWDNFYYRLNYDHSAETGYRNYSGYDSQLLNGRIGWADETQELNLNYKLADISMKYPVQLTEEEAHDLTERTKSPGVHATRQIDTDMASVDYVKSLSDYWKMALTAGKKERAIEYKALSKSSSANDSYMKEQEKANNYIAQFTFNDRLSFGQETRLADIDSYSYGYDRNALKRTDLKTRYDATKGEYAYFAQYTDKYGPLAIRYGVRDDVIDYVNYDKLNNIRKSDKKFSKRTHNGEIGLEVASGAQVYFNYGEAFKAPTFSDLFRSSSAWALANENLTSELAKTQRGGIRFDKRGFNLNWSVYRTIVDDEIISVTNPFTWVATNENAQKTQRDGYDIFAGQKIGAWNFWGNYGFVKARFVEFNDGSTDYEGSELPMVPEETYSLGIDWQGKKLSSSFVYNFVGQQYLASDTSNEQDKLAAYNFSDLKLKYQATKDLSVYLDINNLFNNIYNTKGLWWWNTNWYRLYTPADLRSATIGMKWQF